MKLIAQFHEALSARFVGLATQAEITWADAGATPVTFAVPQTADTTAAADAIVTAYNSLSVSQRTHNGVISKMLALRATVVLVGAVGADAVALATLGQTDGETTVAPNPVVQVLIPDYTVPVAGYSVAQVAAVAAMTALIARTGT